MTQDRPPDTDQIAEALMSWVEISAHRSWQDNMRYIRSRGLSMPQFGVLMFLHHRGRCPVSSVGGHMEISQAAASQLVDGLVNRGLVERREDPDDRRVRSLSLTSPGKDLVVQSTRARLQWIRKVAAELGPEVRAAIAQALPTLVQAAQRYEAPDA